MMKCNPTGLGPVHVFMNLFHLMGHGSAIQPAWCCTHGRQCMPVASDVDVTGSPCQDFAPNGHRLGVHGPQWPVFEAWAAVMLSQNVPVIVHENVPQFDVDALAMIMQHKYLIFTVIVDCAALGFRLISRRRRFTIMYHRTKTRLVCSPVWLHAQLVQAMAVDMCRTAFRICDCFLADAAEIANEIVEVCLAKGIALDTAMQDMTLLLTPGEYERLRLYLEAWVARVGLPAHHCWWAVFNLADNPGAGYTTWSAASGRIPGLRTHNAKLWVPYLGRWLTNRELLACMGVPVYRHLAAAAQVSQVHVRPGSDSRHMLGNMMHIAAVGSVMAVAMASCVVL